MNQSFFNRELSWIEFNARVLGEAASTNNGPLDRAKFAGIFSSNLDEFFMVRVAGLKRQLEGRNRSTCPTGMTPKQQLERIRSRVQGLVTHQQLLLRDEIFPSLSDAGVRIVLRDGFTQEQGRFAIDFFQSELFPLLTPLRIEDEMPFVENLTPHLIVSLHRHHSDEESSDAESVRSSELFRGDADEPMLALVRVPLTFGRCVELPSSESGSHVFTTVDEIILISIERLFPGYVLNESLLFRLTRDADLGVDEERDEDFMIAMEEILRSRQTSFPVRLETMSFQAGGTLRGELMKRYRLNESDVYDTPQFLDPSALVAFSLELDRPDLRETEWATVMPPYLDDDVDIFEAIAESERVVHHPYESFRPIVRLVSEASADPGVLAIKITLYRTSGNSPIVQSLKSAAERGKQVTAFIELKARFDEERNIEWAQELERAGVIVVHGIADLKVHAKALMIVRRERDGIRRYVHLATGNYNDRTARMYSDIGLFTTADDIANDVALVFNAITGYSSVPMLRTISMAPTALKGRLLDLINREQARCRESGSGRIRAKVNSLADPDIIQALYNASRAGVRIELNVRGICMLVPGVPGQSEHIRVVSIVDRYLEHSRVCYFENGGAEEVYLSSADWMPRNLERRVELLFPVRDSENSRRIVSILDAYFSDNCKAHLLLQDGSYRRIEQEENEPERRAQEMLQKEAATRAGISALR